MLLSYLLVSIIPPTNAVASDPENNVKKKSMVLRNLLDLSGSIQVSGGYISNNEYGQDGYCTSFLFQPRLALSGVPIDLTWNIVKPPHGPLQFGRFNLTFTKDAFINYLESKRLDSLNLHANDSLLEYNDVKSQLSDKDYLNHVSESNMQYRKLKNDSVAGKLNANDQMRMDSLRQVVGEYEMLNKKFHDLRFANTINSGLHDTKIQDQQLLNNIKGEGKNISDSLSALPSLSNLNKAQKLFMRFDEIVIGYGVLNHSQLSVNNYPYTGAGINYHYKGIIAGVTAGKYSSFINSSSFSIASVTNYSSRITKQPGIIHVKAGIGDGANYSVLSLSSFYPSKDKLNNLPNDNSKGSVLALVSSKQLGDNSKLEVEISKSYSTSIAPNDNKSNGLNHVGLSAKSTNDLPRLNASISLEYLNIGRDFHTPGNPYLSSGFQLLDFGFSKSILKGKMSSDINLLNSWSNNGKDAKGGWQRYSGSASLRYQVWEKATVSCKYYSNTFYHDNADPDNKQKSQSYQASVNLGLGKSSSLNITGVAGNSSQKNIIQSRNYMASSSYSIKYKRNSLSLQLSYFKTITKIDAIDNSSITIGDHVTLWKKWSTFLSAGANINKHNFSSTLNYGIGYSPSQAIAFDLSGGVNNYSYKDHTSPGYTRFQTMCSMNVNF